jgi:coenzyme F420-0:L-glutamate ligase/coenzyme F420-1:gamma-L-glutamate ligase
MIKDRIPQEHRENRINDSIHQFTHAPYVIVVCLTLEDMDEYLDEQRKENERLMAIQSIAAAIENMLLTAHAEGLGSCWFCAPLFCQDTVRKVLKIPPNVYPQALITLGYPTHIPSPPPRKQVSEVVYLDYWGNSI